jgi:SPP1 family predicted phage head-tail adaptor
MPIALAAGAMRQVITIQNKTVVTDATYGGTTETWFDFAADVRAKREPLSGKELLVAGAEQGIMKVRFRTRWLAGVEPAMRIVHDDKYYDIISVVDVDGLNRELDILTKWRADGN